MNERQIDDEFDKEVAKFKEIFIGWLQNLQKDAYAQGSVIPPEVIAQAFEDLREYYDILTEEQDMDELINKLLGE